MPLPAILLTLKKALIVKKSVEKVVKKDAKKNRDNNNKELLNTNKPVFDINGKKIKKQQAIQREDIRKVTRKQLLRAKGGHSIPKTSTKVTVQVGQDRTITNTSSTTSTKKSNQNKKLSSLALNAFKNPVIIAMEKLQENKKLIEAGVSLNNVKAQARGMALKNR